MARQAVYDVNDYILNGTNVGAMLGWPNSSGIRPIVTVQDQPEVQNDETPWVVYHVRTTTHPTMWWQLTDEVSYYINFNKVMPLNDVSAELFDIFYRMDESAGEINDYLRGIPRVDFTFLSISIGMSLSAGPTDNRGGILSKLFTIRYDYVKTAGRGIE